MAFLEVEFPRPISFGSSGGPGFSTSIIEGESGASERVSRWPSARRKYNVAYGIRTVTDLNKVIDLYIRCAGPVTGFRYYDWLDHSTATDHVSAPTNLNVTLGTSTVTSPTVGTFQLKTQYSYGGSTAVYRTITKPIAGTVVVAINGVNTTSFTVDTATGIISITAGLTAGSSVVTAGCEFNVPVQFGAEIDNGLFASIDNFNSGDLPDLPLIEMVGDVSSPERFYYGGASVITTVADLSVTHSLGRALVYAPSNATTAISWFLPDPSDLELGGPYFHINYRPVTGTGAVAVKTLDGATTIATLDAAGESTILFVYNDGTANKWLALNNF